MSSRNFQILFYNRQHEPFFKVFSDNVYVNFVQFEEMLWVEFFTRFCVIGLFKNLVKMCDF